MRPRIRVRPHVGLFIVAASESRTVYFTDWEICRFGGDNEISLRHHKYKKSKTRYLFSIPKSGVLSQASGAEAVVYK